MVVAQPDSELSGREVAANAGVNHGLVHRYFGKRIDFIGAVLDQLASQMATQLEDDRPTDAGPPTDAGLPSDAETVAVYAKVLARALLDGLEPTQLQKSFPVLTMLHEIAQHDYELDDPTANIAAAQCVALVLGWHLFEPWLINAAGLEDLDPHDLHNALSTTSHTIARSMRHEHGADHPHDR